MKIFTTLILLFVSLSITAQESPKNQIDILNKTKIRIETDIKIKQDSLKIIKQQIENLSRKELFSKMMLQPEGMVFIATMKMPGKIRKESNPNSVVLAQVNKFDTILLTDFIGNYWIVNKGEYFGYINEMYLNDTPELQIYKNAIFERSEKMRLKMEEEKRKREEAVLDKRIEERRSQLIKKYGKENAEKIISRYYWIGMSSEMAHESLGSPETINK